MKVIEELDDFKVEIQQRFAKSKFNHTFKFPRYEGQKEEGKINRVSHSPSRRAIHDKYKKWMDELQKKGVYYQSKYNQFNW
jgi:hypothetical protein